MGSAIARQRGAGAAAALFLTSSSSNEARKSVYVFSTNNAATGLLDSREREKRKKEEAREDPTKKAATAFCVYVIPLLLRLPRLVCQGRLDYALCVCVCVGLAFPTLSIRRLPQPAIVCRSPSHFFEWSRSSLPLLNSCCRRYSRFVQFTLSPVPCLFIYLLLLAVVPPTCTT